jgi:hypothetical protein
VNWLSGIIRSDKRSIVETTEMRIEGWATRPTGTRIDGGHPATTHSDPRAQVPHAHVPGVKNPDGTPWLPITW